MGYRQILIRLKEEFIKSEQDHAVAVAAEKSRSSGRAKEQPLAGVEELSDLRSQVLATYIPLWITFVISLIDAGGGPPRRFTTGERRFGECEERSGKACCRSTSCD